MNLNDRWFTEQCDEAGCALSYRIEAHLHSEQSRYQKIDIYQTTDWGRLMAIDGFVMLTGRDNFLYHEMMTHPALFTHDRPEDIVIVGGGDCGTLREVLKHASVRRAVQVEIDERVTRLAEQYFPELCESNDDPRAELQFADGVKFIAQLPNASQDLVIVDSTDPIGPAEGLFGPAFVADCERVLRPGGILVQQSESPLIHQNIIRPLRDKMRNASFADVRTLPFPQPCYPSGWWSCTLARKAQSLESFRTEAVETRQFATRYYNADIHRAALARPEFMKAW